MTPVSAVKAKGEGEGKGLLWLLAAAGLLAVVLFLLLRSPDRPATEPPARAATAPSAPGLAPTRPALALAPGPQAAGPGPFIDAVLVEDDAVCEGAENLVTVRAHAGDPAEDVHLVATIDGQLGMAVPIVARRPTPDSPWPKVVVADRHGRLAEAPVPSFTIKDCTPTHTMEILYGARLNTAYEFELEARISGTSASEPFAATSYFWDFGDGNAETTSTPFVVHSYGKRPQDSAMSFFLVRVEARSASDELVLGRRSLRIMNTEYQNLVHTGIVTLVVELNPRFPELDSQGGVTQGVHLWHHATQPVTITRLEARRNYVQDAVPSDLREVPVASVLGTSSIPPGGIWFKARLDRSAEKDVFSIDYLLEGETADGKPVSGVFSVMSPPIPTADHHIPVTDPDLHQKIVRARELLGKEFVTDEDFAELDRRGVPGFKPFRPSPRSQGGPAGYPVLEPGTATRAAAAAPPGRP